jgi:phage terminase large subunit GpA-like protein
MVSATTTSPKLPRQMRQAIRDEFRTFLTNARPRQVRPRLTWAQDEFVIPAGRAKNFRWAPDRQPFAAMLLAEIDRERYRRVVILGCTQSGKTQTGFIIPTLYHLFEIREDVINGFPDMDMAADKWNKDLRPAIEASPYKHLLPESGAGSRGGKVESITFKHGVTLKFMSGGGSDKSRAGFESRVVIITETDGMDSAGEGSREADKIKQLEARTYSHGDRKQIYMECTVSTEEGRTWSEYQTSTLSRIACRCPHCRQFVTLEREHFIGHENAKNIEEARELGRFHCYECGEQWSEQDRIDANRDAVLLHGDQVAAEDGTITGEIPKTDTLGFRWSAVNNLFWSQAFIAGEEWKAAQEENRENAEKERLQFCWVKPYRASIEDLAELRRDTIPHRILPQHGPQLIPADTQQFTLGVDYNSHFVHFVATAFRNGHTPHVPDYGAIPVRYDRHQTVDSPAFEAALLAALRELFARCDRGWTWVGRQTTRKPDQVWIDSNWKPEILAAALEGRDRTRYYPVEGYGFSQERRLYKAPGQLNPKVKFIGDGYHLARQASRDWTLIEIDVDQWKSWWHSRLVAPLANPTAAPATLYDDLASTHDEIARHWTAERQIEEWIPGKGIRRGWQRLRKNNHWLDAAVYAAAAGHYMGVRLPGFEPIAAAPETPVTQSALQTPSAQPFFVLDRN